MTVVAATFTPGDDELSYILAPDGLSRPADMPDEIFQAALRTYLSPRRLDMQALAAELGIGRTTLYRRVKHRDHLLGQVCWYLGRVLIADALATPPDCVGAARIVEVVRRFLAVNELPAHRRFLNEEPEAAMRILTSKHAPVQRGIVQIIERLIEVEEAKGKLVLSLPRAPLAFGIVRIVESFLYADVIADAEPDVDRAVDLIDALLAGISQPLRAHRRTRR